jgi:gas vesicle protein
MTYENNNSSLVFFLLGSIVGAAAALLLTPKTGREARHLLKESGFNFRKLAEKGLDAGKESVDDIIEQGREFVDEMGHRLIAAFEAGKEAMKEELSKERGRGQGGGPTPETY